MWNASLSIAAEDSSFLSFKQGDLIVLEGDDNGGDHHECRVVFRRVCSHGTARGFPLRVCVHPADLLQARSWHHGERNYGVLPFKLQTKYHKVVSLPQFVQSATIRHQLDVIFSFSGFQNIPAHQSQRSYICKTFRADIPPASSVTKRWKNSNYRYRERGLYGYYRHKTWAFFPFFFLSKSVLWLLSQEKIGKMKKFMFYEK